MDNHYSIINDNSLRILDLVMDRRIHVSKELHRVKLESFDAFFEFKKISDGHERVVDSIKYSLSSDSPKVILFLSVINSSSYSSLGVTIKITAPNGVIVNKNFKLKHYREGGTWGYREGGIYIDDDKLVHIAKDCIGVLRKQHEYQVALKAQKEKEKQAQERDAHLYAENLILSGASK